jgi:hypothetical protein
MWFKVGQDRQCTYNLTIKHIHATIVALERQQVLHVASACF